MKLETHGIFCATGARGFPRGIASNHNDVNVTGHNCTKRVDFGCAVKADKKDNMVVVVVVMVMMMMMMMMTTHTNEETFGLTMSYSIKMSEVCVCV